MLGLFFMNILNVTPFYFPCGRGGERHVQEVSERLVARGHQVTVLTTNVTNEQEYLLGLDCTLPAVEVINGVRVIRVPARAGASASIINWCWRMKRGRRLLRSLFTESGIDLLRENPRNLNFFRSVLRSRVDFVTTWNWYWPPAYHVSLARQLKKFRQIGVPFFHTADLWVQRPIYDQMIMACDGLFVNTEHEKDFILRRLPHAKRIVVVGPGVEPQLFKQRNGAAFRTRYSLGRNPLVGFVGHISAHKGVDKLVEAMPLVWKGCKEARLIVAGYCSNNFPQLDQVLHSFLPEERKRILILPNFAENEKADLYDALDVFVLPSIVESFGIAYLEAWTCGKPVIGARIGSTASVIEEGVDGLLVDPGDPRDIARTILELLADPIRRHHMGQHGYTKTLEHFTWEKIVEKIEHYYKGLLTQECRRLA